MLLINVFFYKTVLLFSFLHAKFVQNYFKSKKKEFSVISIHYHVSVLNLSLFSSFHSLLYTIFKLIAFSVTNTKSIIIMAKTLIV